MLNYANVITAQLPGLYMFLNFFGSLENKLNIQFALKTHNDEKSQR
jgi:hypothetical protein